MQRGRPQSGPNGQEVSMNRYLVRILLEVGSNPNYCLDTLTLQLLPCFKVNISSRSSGLRTHDSSYQHSFRKHAAVTACMLNPRRPESRHAVGCYMSAE